MIKDITAYLEKNSHGLMSDDELKQMRERHFKQDIECIDIMLGRKTGSLFTKEQREFLLKSWDNPIKIPNQSK